MDADANDDDGDDRDKETSQDKERQPRNTNDKSPRRTVTWLGDAVGDDDDHVGLEFQ